MESRRDPNADRVPRAGRLDEPGGVPEQRPRLGNAPVQRVPVEPEPPQARGRLSHQRRRLADRHPQFQCRRRQHDPLFGALPALPPVGFPGEDTRRRRRRLADRLLGTRALLRRERPQHRRLGSRRGSGHPVPRAAAATRADGAHGRGHGTGLQQAWLALVAVGHGHRDARLQRPRPVPEPRARATPAAPKAPRAAPTSPTGRWRSAPGSNCAPTAGCARSRSTTATWRPASPTSTPTASSATNAPKW